MALANMQVYDTEIYTTTIELLGQKLEAFNAASGGAIVLNTNAWRGNYTKEAFFQSISGAQRRVDRNAAIGAQAATQLSQGEFVGVKVAGGFGPVTFEPGQMSYLLENPASAIMVIAEGFSDALLADQLNTAVGCGVAAVENIAALVNDVSATAGLSQQALNKGHYKFGDMSGMLICDVMHSSGSESLTDKALANGEQLFVSSMLLLLVFLVKSLSFRISRRFMLQAPRTRLRFYQLRLAVSLFLTLVILSLTWTQLTDRHVLKPLGKLIILSVLALKVMLGMLLMAALLH